MKFALLPRRNKEPSLHLPGKTNYGIRQHSLGSVPAISDPVARKRTETSCPLHNKNIWIRTRLCNKGPQSSPVAVTPAQKESLLHKALHSEAAVNIPLYIQHKPTMKTRRSHSLKFIPLHTRCDEYKYSFWPRTIQDWNNLQPEILDIIDTNTFSNMIK